MSFWIVTGLSALLSVAVLVVALLRGRAGQQPAAAYDLQVYRDQLKEVDRDLARKVIEEADAERLRNEISRRILAADAAMKADQAQDGKLGRIGWLLGAALSVVVIGGSFGLYRQLGAPGYGDLGLQMRIAMANEAYRSRPSQEVAETRLPPVPSLETVPQEHRDLVQQLRDTVAERPDDLQGHILLAQEEARLGRYRDAYEAQEIVLRLKGAEATGDDFAMMATMMTLAAGEYVSPEAEIFLQEAVARDPENPLARYHIGLMMLQTGRPDQAFVMWERLLRESPPHAPWSNAIRPHIEDVAIRAGVQYTLPEAAPAPPALRGPTEDDVDAMQDMAPEDQMEMIRGMVAGLSDRLAAEGGSPEEWAQLINALGVLGDREQAQVIFDEARLVFAGNPAAIGTVTSAAQRAGLIE
ncbi:MAG: c-type cytochrome biogenesis protein CcmI [Rhodobacteraceae bacterium]|nr:c-type cytochrome biogenesis protein CcmI [Paracoccaceae bacterium]